VYRTLRGPVVALLALVLALSVPLNADATRQPPGPDRGQRGFTPAEARDLLAKAKRQVRPDTRRVRAGKPVEHGPLTELTMTLRDLFLARTALSGEDRREADALLARPSDAGGDDLDGDFVGDVSYDGYSPRRYCPTGANTCVHYVVSGPERVSTTDNNANGFPDYVETVSTVMQQVWNYETGVMGYRPPLADDGTSAEFSNPDSRLDVYLADLGKRGLYGYCAPEGAMNVHQLPGYCVLDNNYAQAEYGTIPTFALKATAAHEFFHAVQFGYDVDEDIWFMEGSAAWVEDEVYNTINDNYQYLAFSKIRYPRLPTDYSTGLHRYGAWLFFRYAAEKLADRNVVRRMWEVADAGAGNAYSLQAVESAISTSTDWRTFFATFGSWNTLPTGTYRERANYPPPVYLHRQTLTAAKPSTGFRSANLPHISGSAIQVAPGSKLPTTKQLVVDVNAPDASHGSVAVVQTRFRNGNTVHRMLPLNAYGNASQAYYFNRRSVSSVVVVVSNASTAMRDCGTVFNNDGPIYSCAGRGVYDSGQTFQVRARLK
jgi:hypothetical protein